MVWTASDLRDVFQKKEIHESWETVYRRGRSQQLFNERMLARIRGLDLIAFLGEEPFERHHDSALVIDD